MTIGAAAVLVLTSASVATPAAVGASFDHALAWGYFVGPKPAQVGELLGVTAVAAEKRGYRASDSIFGMALLGDGTVSDWTAGAAPMPASGLSEVTAITIGASTLALLSDGTVMEVAANSPPVPVGEITNATAIASGPGNDAVVLSDGTVRTWGSNTYGELGNGLSGQGSSTPVEVCAVGTEGPCPHGPYLSGVKAVAVGEGFILALMNDGTVAAWGYDYLGELGNGYGSPFEAHPNPVLIGSLSGVTAISAGGSHGDALKSDGTVEEWGGTVDGNGPLPSPVSGLSNVTAISSGSGFSMALLGDGTVMTWGTNSQGQLAHKSGPTPAPASGVAGATAIDAGAYSALAVVPTKAPAVTKVKPTSGPVGGGTTVTISGNEFTQLSSVKFGSTEATSFTRNSPTSLTATTPPELAGPVDVTVTTPVGTSAPTSKDHFKFTPTITDVTPKGGLTSGGESVTVIGSGFITGTTGTRFTFGGKPGKSVSCASTTECTVVSPAHSAGTVDVRAVVNKATSPIVTEDKFTYS